MIRGLLFVSDFQRIHSQKSDPQDPPSFAFHYNYIYKTLIIHSFPITLVPYKYKFRFKSIVNDCLQIVFLSFHFRDEKTDKSNFQDINSVSVVVLVPIYKLNEIQVNCFYFKTFTLSYHLIRIS